MKNLKTRNLKIVRRGALLLLCLFALVLVVIFARTALFAASTNSTSSKNTPTTAQTNPPTATPPPLRLQQHQAPTPTATAIPTPTPTEVPAIPTQAPTTAPPLATGGEADRYFPAGTSVDAIKSGGANLTRLQIKTLIEQQVDQHWAFIQSRLGFSTVEKAYAFFLGMATRESTLQGALETGNGASHSYGPLQASETAYANANPIYSQETDVPEMFQYDFTPENYYDPGITVHMGIRHLIHFADQAIAAGYSGKEMLRHALIGYNTGEVETNDQDWLRQYSDEIGALGGWYLYNSHFTDEAFTWTDDPAVDRSNYWGWY
jgi:hypothetical protein